MFASVRALRFIGARLTTGGRTPECFAVATSLVFNITIRHSAASALPNGKYLSAPLAQWDRVTVCGTELLHVSAEESKCPIGGLQDAQQQDQGEVVPQIERLPTDNGC